MGGGGLLGACLGDLGAGMGNGSFITISLVNAPSERKGSSPRLIVRRWILEAGDVASCMSASVASVMALESSA
jgi:hypothetical protein